MKDTPFRAMEKKALDEVRLRHLQEGVTLDPVIISMGELYLTGMEMRGLHSNQIGKLWNSFRKRVAEIDRRQNHESVYYALIELTGTEWEVSYTACVEVSGAGRTPEGMIDKILPRATYAVFSHKGIRGNFTFLTRTKNR
ncbi:hypothetical protein J14TS5_58670 [Paenibacillus lautus]|uniref:GyrI-like domain-containing protein n=1 Tax=Paenibacillus lautus TaxID=1401 RepID=UPI001B283AE3|nr:GyrI-like domain-containing protein [Paenibacillus lautus]GIP00782.1 hypothetical protein J14TS5_58670 [Paenibacillus lautus]